MNFIYSGLVVSLILFIIKLFGFDIAWWIIPAPFLVSVFCLVLILVLGWFVLRNLK